MNPIPSVASLALVLALPIQAMSQSSYRTAQPLRTPRFAGEPADNAFATSEMSYGTRQSHSERASLGLFDDTGELPCSLEPNQPLIQCSFGVAREQGGNASLRIQLPGGHERLIVFARGEPLTANLDGEESQNGFMVRHERHTYLINTGRERFAIPDVLITSPPNHPG